MKPAASAGSALLKVAHENGPLAAGTDKGNVAEVGKDVDLRLGT